VKKSEISFEPLPESNDFRVLQDGEQILTPRGHPVSLPNRALAEAFCETWRENPFSKRELTLVQLVYAALDRAFDPEETLAYGETDLLCYRCDSDAALFARQETLFDPWLRWAKERLGVSLRVTRGVLPIRQPEENAAMLMRRLNAYHPWRQASLAHATRLSGSVILGFALLEKAIDTETLHRLATLEETHQTGLWGEDEEKAAKLCALRRDMETVGWFLDAI
jgi:chaperone required for assembly of F1-ATPase